tara:strand:- start:71 stop:916 length:846 start_codon:yes stop_codon:yes gene_type:complete
MKSIILILLTAIIWPHDHKKEIKITDEISTGGTPKTIVIDNIFGEITIKRSSSSSIKYDVTKTISARNESDLQKGISEINLKVINRNDSIILYLAAPFICDKWSGCYRQGRWIQREKDDYDFVFDFELEIPANSTLDVQTVDQGNVQITGIEGLISANNVNGDVTIKGARAIDEASTVNGDVDVFFKSNPSTDGTYKTINGTINLYLMDQMNAKVSAKTMHGNLYSAFDYESIAPKLKKTTSKSDEATIYELDQSFAIEIGQNGPLLSFETLNGDIYLKRQ